MYIIKESYFNQKMKVCVLLYGQAHSISGIINERTVVNDDSIGL